MNSHDSEHIRGVLSATGMRESGSVEAADLVVFNGCCVRKSAEDRLWGNLSALLADDSHPGRLVAVCGCVAERYRLEILRRYPGVSLVFGMDRLGALPDLLAESVAVRLCDLGDVNNAAIDGLPTTPASGARAWVPISHGCDNNCAYCVVPLVRGAQRSRCAGDVIDEVEKLAASGVVEVTLLGQNVNAYEGGCSFAGLLERVAGVPGIRRVKFETSHPKDMGDDILEAMGRIHEICEHLHLPVQSGSSRILRAMNRGYDREYYLQRLAAAREAVPGVSITTDIIVGFPGEDLQDHLRTAELVEHARFDAVFLFMYSPRDGTPAVDLPGEVPREEVRRRFAELEALQEEITSACLESMVGTVQEVLVEGPARRGEILTGRSRGNRVVLLEPGECGPGDLVSSRITAAGRHSLRGVVTEVCGRSSGVCREGVKNR